MWTREIRLIAALIILLTDGLGNFLNGIFFNLQKKAEAVGSKPDSARWLHV